MGTIIGRKNEKKKLLNILNSKQPEFLAIYGRRRVGKTYLISEFFQGKGLYFETTGQLQAKLSDQLENFTKSLEYVFYQGLEIKRPKTWKDAFEQLKSAIDRESQKRQKIILFIDEVQYANDPSNFLKYLYDVYGENLKIVATGSSAFYIDKKFTDSLSGRKRVFELRTLSFEEYIDFTANPGLSQELKLIRNQHGYIS